jgi:hypothetical protein
MPTTPDLVERTRSIFEAMDRDVMVQEWVDGQTVLITSYAEIGEARAFAERLAEERR